MCYRSEAGSFQSRTVAPQVRRLGLENRELQCARRRFGVKKARLACSSLARCVRFLRQGGGEPRTLPVTLLN